GEWIKLSLRDVRGPGHFSVWQPGTFGSYTLWMSTYDGGITSDDALFQLAQGHTHYNWAFTAPGMYEIDFQASAYLGPGMSNPTTSAVVTYYFCVEAPDEMGGGSPGGPGSPGGGIPIDIPPAGLLRAGPSRLFPAALFAEPMSSPAANRLPIGMVESAPV